MTGAARAGFLAAAALCCAPAAAAAVQVQDVRSGQAVALEPGAPCLHIVFFATWCPPCVDELPRLAELKSRWSDGRYRVALVAVANRHSLPKLAGFFQSRPGLPEVFFDFEGQAERAWKAGDLPTHVVLDAAGREIARSGALDSKIEAAIRGQLVGGRGPARDQTP